jgi:hypothetical protein
MSAVRAAQSSVMTLLEDFKQANVSLKATLPPAVVGQTRILDDGQQGDRMSLNAHLVLILLSLYSPVCVINLT